MTAERASKRQQELLQFVDGFIKGNGYGPSYREIMRALGYKSVSTVAIHIDGLIAKGYLARKDNSARSLEVVSLKPDDQPATSAPDPEAAVIERLSAISLSKEQREAARITFELLGYEKVVAALEESSDEG